MKLYCANCGQRLTLIRKALPKFGTIVDLVQYHECPKEVDANFKFDMALIAPKVEGYDKCVQSLNALEPPPKLSLGIQKAADEALANKGSGKTLFGGVGTDDLRDRRFDSVTKSTAPSSIAEQIRQMANSIPAHEIAEIEKGGPQDEESSEMGG